MVREIFGFFFTNFLLIGPVMIHTSRV